MNAKIKKHKDSWMLDRVSSLYIETVQLNSVNNHSDVIIVFPLLLFCLNYFGAKRIDFVITHTAVLIQRLDQRSYSTLGLVNSWMSDRLWVGKASWYVISHVPRSTQPSIPPGYVNRVSVFLAGVKAGCVHVCRVAGNTV